MADSDHNPITALALIAGGLYERMHAAAVAHERLRIQYRNMGSNPISLPGPLGLIAQSLYTRMLAYAVERERLMIQYTNCLRGMDRISNPQQ
jgi:hypothetical protein